MPVGLPIQQQTMTNNMTVQRTHDTSQCGNVFILILYRFYFYINFPLIRNRCPPVFFLFHFEFIVLDASGQVAAGFVWGNNYWMGSKKECERVNDPTKVVLSERLAKNHLINLTEIASPFPVQYKMTWAKHESRWQLDINTFEKVRIAWMARGKHTHTREILNSNWRFDVLISHYRPTLSSQTIVHLGLCLPRSCNDADVRHIVDSTLNDRTFGEHYFFGDEPFRVSRTHSLVLRENFWGTLIVQLFLYVLAFQSDSSRWHRFISSTSHSFGRWALAVNLIFVIIGSIYTSVVMRMDAKAKTVAHSRIINGTIANNNNNINNVSITVNVDGDANQHRPAKRVFKRLPIVDRFFSCFSLAKNSSIITTDYLGTESIEVIHGMRLVLFRNRI